tara:strand:+ start:580 stop:822 length:243 start_codon:yes stop_codon:yes gene_type:complete
MKKPTSPQKSPYKFKVVQGKIYPWCTCGLSQKQPFCDGSHREEGIFRSLKHTAEETKEVYFCGCKMTKTPPFCDGTHSKF